MKHSHYFKSVKHLDHIDVYRVLDLFGVADNALGHAAKKILCAGIRGAKDQAKDVQEAIDTLTRWQQMQAENHIEDKLEKGDESDKTITFSNPSYQEWVDKELPSSGIYSDAGYTEQDMQAASLVHDAELNPDLVALCANTTIHADKDGWIEHHGNECPVSDVDALVHVKTHTSESVAPMSASDWTWNSYGQKWDITHWRYAK